MKTVLIEDDIYSYLQSNAVPFEDDESSVLRKLLGLDEKDTPQVSLAQEHYQPAILQVLSEMGGQGRKSQVLDRVGELLKHLHSDFDLEKYRSGEVRWRHRASDEKKNMVDKGLLERDVSYGIWKLTEVGWAKAGELQN